MKITIHKDKNIYITDSDGDGKKIGYLWIGTDEECFGYIDGIKLQKLKSWFNPNAFKKNTKRRK